MKISNSVSTIILHYFIFRKKTRKLWSFKMLRYSIHCQAMNFFDMIISERLCRLERCAIREIRDVVQLCRNRWGSTKYEKLERIYASFFYCSLLLSSQKLVNLTLTNDFFFYTLPKNCESCTCKIPAKSTTTNCQRFSYFSKRIFG